MCGIKISQKSPEIHSFNVINLTVFILLCLYVGCIALLLTDTEIMTFNEYTDMFFRIGTIGTFGMVYEIIVSKMSKLFEFVNSLADIVQASECNK